MNAKLFRFFLYIFSITATGEFLVLDMVSFGGGNDFSGTSYTKYLQWIILSAIVLLLIINIANIKFRFRYISLFQLYLIICIFFINSEMNNLLSLSVIFLLTIAFFLFLKRNYIEFIEEVKIYTTLLSFGFLFIGFMLSGIFSNMMGRDFFWTAVLEGADFTLAQNAVKEGLKLLGYLIILFSVIELRFGSRKNITYDI